MNVRAWLVQGAYFFAYLLLQLLVFSHMALFDLALCYFYIGFIIFLPSSANRYLVLLLAFILGLFVDISYNTLGIHLFATLFVAFIKKYLLALSFAGTTIDPPEEVSIFSLGYNRFVLYTLGTLLIHIILIAVLQSMSLGLMSHLLVSYVFTLLLTFTSLGIFQYLV